jgi:hypothetical protein
LRVGLIGPPHSTSSSFQSRAGAATPFRPFLLPEGMTIMLARNTPAKKSTLWNIEKRDAFLTALAQTANVSASARAAKMKEAQAYTERRKSATFRAAWEVALSEGYAKLELMMLERAMKAMGAEAETFDPAKTRLEEYSNKLAMTLLTAHRATVRGEKKGAPTTPGTGQKADVKTRLTARFDAMHERLKADDGQS